LWLGVTSVGLNIYDERDKLTPKTTFQWNEIRHVSFDDKKFTIRLVDAKVSNFIFYSQDLHINKMVLEILSKSNRFYIISSVPCRFSTCARATTICTCEDASQTPWRSSR